MNFLLKKILIITFILVIGLVISALISITFINVMTIIGVIFAINTDCDNRWGSKVDE